MLNVQFSILNGRKPFYLTLHLLSMQLKIILFLLLYITFVGTNAAE